MEAAEDNDEDDLENTHCVRKPSKSTQRWNLTCKDQYSGRRRGN